MSSDSLGGADPRGVGPESYNLKKAGVCSDSGQELSHEAERIECRQLYRQLTAASCVCVCDGSEGEKPGWHTGS